MCLVELLSSSEASEGPGWSLERPSCLASALAFHSERRGSSKTVAGGICRVLRCSAAISCHVWQDP